MLHMTPPILFIIFNRPDLAEQSFAKIRQARPSRLFIAADGPRVHLEGESALCDESRQIVDQVDWPCDVKTLFRAQNLGCRKAVISAISWFFEHVDEGVIIEDDCVADPSFFQFCESLLHHYRNDTRVMLISAESFGSLDFWNKRPSYTFSAMPLIWGWATWKRAWDKYDESLSFMQIPGIEEWLASHLRSENAAKYWMQEFKKVSDGHLNTWDYQWIASIWRQGGLSAHPRTNLLTNIGCDFRGTHTTNPDWEMGKRKYGSLDSPISHPQDISWDYCYDQIILKERFGIAEPTLDEQSGKKLVQQFFHLGRLIARRLLHKSISPLKR